MKRIIPVLLCAVMLFSLMPVKANAEEVTINVYNWGQYISDGTDGYIDVNKAFTERTGIKVNYMTFDSNETMYTKLKTGLHDSAAYKGGYARGARLLEHPQL